MRRLGLVLALSGSLFLAAVPAAAAKTIEVDWRERVPVEGGAIAFRITKVVATTSAWAVTARIQNASEGRVTLEPKGRSVALPSPHPLWANGMALIEAHRVYDANIAGRHFQWWQHPARIFRPALPSTVAPGGSWTGTFGGRSKLRKGQAYSIGFGLFGLESAESGGRSVFWITDHSFTL